jgi:hypothetical protein
MTEPAFYSLDAVFMDPRSVIFLGVGDFSGCRLVKSRAEKNSTTTHKSIMDQPDKYPELPPELDRRKPKSPKDEERK